MKARIEELKSIPKEDRETHYHILWGEKVVLLYTNDYIDAKRVVALLDEPYNQAEDSHGLCEITWRIPLKERKILTKLGLNGYALRRVNKTTQNVTEIMQ